MLLTTTGRIVNITEAENGAVNLLNAIESAYYTRMTKLKDYFKEINGQTVIPPPKLEWQSNFVSSLFYQKIFFAYSLLRKFLDKAFENLFIVETNDPILREAIHKVLTHYIQITNLKQTLSEVLYYSLFSGYGLIYFDYDTKLKQITLTACNPLLTKITPDKNYLVITQYLPTPQAIEKYNLDPNEVLFYNLTTEEEETFYYLKNITNNAITRIDEIYGTVVLNGHEAILPARYILVNKNKLIQAEILDPLEKPYVCEFLYGINAQVSYADLIYPYHVQDTILTRTLLDTAILSLTIGIELDATSIDTDKTITELEPFQIVYKKTTEDVIKNFSLANFNPNVLPIRQLILNEATNISALTEFVMGLPTSKGRPTAKEVALKTQQSIQTLSVFIEKFETFFLTQVLEKLLYYIIKYEAPNLQNLLPAQEFVALSEISPVDLQKRIKFKIISMSQTLQKQERIEKLMSFLQLLGELNLIPVLDLNKLIREFLYLLDLPTDILNPNIDLNALLQQQATQEEKS